MIVNRMLEWARCVMYRRGPDFVIIGKDSEYLRRWWIIPRNRWFNIYLHEILRSDEDRALHDHPWFNCSFLLFGSYREHRIAAGGIETVTVRRAGSLVFRSPWTAHRLEVDEGHPALSLFITGPRLRNWGFHCTKAGFVPWQDFVAPDDAGAVGKGCGE